MASQPHKTALNQKGKQAAKCWNCDRTGHLAKDCRAPRKESTGQSDKRTHATRVVRSTPAQSDASSLNFLTHQKSSTSVSMTKEASHAV